MSNQEIQQRSMDRAQRMYDAQLPPGSDDVECPECEGEGTIPTSMCCDAEMRNGICMNCAEHADYSVCPTCLGNKTVDKSAVDAEREMEKADHQMDEER